MSFKHQARGTQIQLLNPDSHSYYPHGTQQQYLTEDNLPKGTELFLLNKQISTEATYRFYTSNTFVFKQDDFTGQDFYWCQEESREGSPMLTW
jgi:hypothetical protein